MAVQALMYLAQADAACSSSAMAPELNAHAVFLRRVLAQLGHIRAAIGRGSRINKLLIINSELPGRAIAILVKEPLGF